MTSINYYTILDIKKNASLIEIKRAYHKIILRYYDCDNETFNKITTAFYVLSHPTYREIYDKYGIDGLIKNGIYVFDINYMEVFLKEYQYDFKMVSKKDSSLILSSTSSNVINVTENITLGDVITGKYVVKTITRKSICAKCLGNGSDDGILRLCKKCQGRKTLLTLINETPALKLCNFCNGIGNDTSIHKCIQCNGTRIVEEQIEIKFLIPIGVEQDEIITLNNNGNIIIGNNKRDDIKITVHIDDDSTFTFKNKDLYTNMTISFTESICGFKKELILPNNETVNVECQTIIKDGQIYKVENRGLPKRNNKNIRGDLYITLNVIYPTTNKISKDLSSKLQVLLNDLQ